MQPNREMQHLLEQADKKIESDMVVLRQANSHESLYETTRKNSVLPNHYGITDSLKEPKKEVPKQKSLGGL